MYHFTFVAWFISLLSCGITPKPGTTEKTVLSRNVHQKNTVKTGAQRMDKYLPLLSGKKVACVVNQTSTIGKTHLVDTLLKSGIAMIKIFAPEHGFRGKADAGETVGNEMDKKTGLPVLSIYGNKKKPSKEDLAGVDIVLFDIQDVGVRFYTYISTLHYVMEACAEQGKTLIVLDRPNPHAHYIDGPILDPKYASFIGMHKVPIVYGMTIGEYAMMVNGEGWLANNIKCTLQVIPCDHYKRNAMYTLPVKPSPNLPNQNAVLLYPSICLFEGTTMSVGRGTDKQFQVIGHPQLKSNLSFTPVPNEGAKEPLHQGLKCYGEDLSGNDMHASFTLQKIDISYIIKYFKIFSQLNEKYFLDNMFFDKLAGTDKLRKQITAGVAEVEIRQSWEKGLIDFRKIRSKYLIYK